MTNKLTVEEVIQILDDMKVKINVPKQAITQNKRNQALDMAIQALKELAIAKEFIRWVDHFALDVFTDEKYENALTDTILEGLSMYKYKLEKLNEDGCEDDE